MLRRAEVFLVAALFFLTRLCVRKIRSLELGKATRKRTRQRRQALFHTPCPLPAKSIIPTVGTVNMISR